jgi:hypothetical protein
MHGNAAEWVLDRLTPAILRRAGRSSPINWPMAIHPRVVRGGSWNDDAASCRSASRLGSSTEWMVEEANLPRSPWWLASGIQRQIGFRLARPLHAPSSAQRTRCWDADVPELREAVEIRCLQDGRGYLGIHQPDG